MSIITKTINVGWSRPFEITILCVQILNRLSDHTLHEKHGILQNPIIEIYYWGRAEMDHKAYDMHLPRWMTVTITSSTYGSRVDHHTGVGVMFRGFADLA